MAWTRSKKPSGVYGEAGATTRTTFRQMSGADEAWLLRWAEHPSADERVKLWGLEPVQDYPHPSVEQEMLYRSRIQNS